MSSLKWLKSLPDKVVSFVASMQEKEFSHMKYSYSGDFLDSDKKWGLGNRVFATKILHTINKLDSLTEVEKSSLTLGIRSFRTPCGFYFDPYITSYPLFEKLGLTRPDKTKLDIRIAETRQTYIALELLEQVEKNTFLHIPATKEQLTSYLESYDWTRPWHAASHFSHILFFLAHNRKISEEPWNELVAHAVEWVHRLQKDDGCWYQGESVSLSERINGALKVMTGLHAAGVSEFSHYQALIDTALIAANNNDACGNFNISYILYACTLIDPDYRRQEIDQFMIDRLAKYKSYYFPELGGFSFRPGYANKVYYGKEITAGKTEPDIHGTNMFVLGIAAIGKVIDLPIELSMIPH